jgi:NADPH:quinone reductase-like Zn-dependent oxidoreductase
MRGRLTANRCIRGVQRDKEEDVAIKPKALTMEEAASIPLVGLTAWQALIERARLKPGQKVLIHAGSGGMGTFAIQLAKHVGATVATTTSTANVVSFILSVLAAVRWSPAHVRQAIRDRNTNVDRLKSASSTRCRL